MNPIQGMLGRMGGGAMMGALRQRPEDEAVDPSKMARPRPVVDSSGISTVQNLADVSRPELPKRNMADLGGGVAPPRNMADMGAAPGLLGGTAVLNQSARMRLTDALQGGAPGAGEQSAAPAQAAPAERMQQVNSIVRMLGGLSENDPRRQSFRQMFGPQFTGFDPQQVEAAQQPDFQSTFRDDLALEMILNNSGWRGLLGGLK